MNEEQPTLAANPLPACATERSRLLPAFQPETFRKLAREKMWPDVEHIPVIGRLANILGGPRMLVSRPACLWSTTPRGAGPERRRASVNEEN